MLEGGFNGVLYLISKNILLQPTVARGGGKPLSRHGLRLLLRYRQQSGTRIPSRMQGFWSCGSWVSADESVVKVLILADPLKDDPEIGKQ
jgi:hypothetical protein